MALDDMKTIGVVGAGQMGCGIAQVLAQAGWNTLLVDVERAALQRAMKTIEQGLGRAVEKGKLTKEQVHGVLQRIQPMQDVARLEQAHLIIEAIPEDPDLKHALFNRLGRVCPPETILASNTSSISIDGLGVASNRPDRTIGIHFMQPVPVMKLVEVVRGKETSEQTVAIALALVERLGKTAIVCKDSPGFIVNRVLIPMINEAIFALEDGVATPEAIDQAMRDGLNHPVGPLALADRIGLDTVLAICEVLYQQLGDSKFRPCPLLARYVQAGWLGRKSGQGFYTYEMRDERKEALTTQS
ncbi:MAG: 3-hydroxybutyryl-CoA dehydrogenase [Nitrospirae bacterium CG_4_9_14_3_um_filter_51_5]|nr:MAG: 3-hydroxybutyryl-CoA dehydrogenase [Nitrospirae bacterium CG_4_9_14_3_um_filter_51_5]